MPLRTVAQSLRRIAPSTFLFAAIASAQTSASGWPDVGGTVAGQRYSQARQIDTHNVTGLERAWTFHTHALDSPDAETKRSSFEATPILWNDTLYLDTAYDAVFALDASTGALKWKYDPHVPRRENYNVASRGVALWHAASARPGLCNTAAIFVATLDRRLMALDAASGALCPGFGKNGIVDLTQGVAIGPQPFWYAFTSPATVVGDTLVLGSMVADNRSTFAASGAIRGFNVHTGRQTWSWEPMRSVDANQPRMVGSGNAWSLLAADPEHDLVFIPTGSASVDFYGGTRPGDNRDANSLVALRASTGEKVWAFQLVHHDLWDYDTPAQPLLFTFRDKVPAVAIVTKTNMVFIFNRLTGEPLYPVEERAVPASTVPGESASATQPFSSLPALGPQSYNAADLHLSSPAAQRFCTDYVKRLINGGLYTPPSFEGSLDYPGNLGGANWGSAALDPASSTLYARTSSLPFEVRQVRRVDKGLPKLVHSVQGLFHDTPEPPPISDSAFKTPDSGGQQRDFSGQDGAPYTLARQAILAPDGTPCAPSPFGSIVAINLDSGQKLWSVAHGQMVAGEPGSIGVGGVIVTGGGLLFAASTNDPYLRAYDSHSGSLLWKGQLPVYAEATPMTYVSHGRQFVVLAAGGHGSIAPGLGDSVVAFALPVPPAKTRTVAPRSGAGTVRH